MRKDTHEVHITCILQTHTARFCLHCVVNTNMIMNYR